MKSRHPRVCISSSDSSIGKRWPLIHCDLDCALTLLILCSAVIQIKQGAVISGVVGIGKVPVDLVHVDWVGTIVIEGQGTKEGAEALVVSQIISNLAVLLSPTYQVKILRLRTLVETINPLRLEL